MAKNLVWRQEGRIFVAVHAAQPPTNLEWAGYVRTALEASNRGEVRVLAVSYGGAPDGSQRGSLTKALAGRPSPTALLSGSRVVRALTNAFGWFNPRMKAFDLAEHQPACDFLGLSAVERQRALVLRHECEAELDIDPTAVRPSVAPSL